MEQKPPQRGTQPLNRPTTKHFSDAFVSSQLPTGMPVQRGTRQLAVPPAAALKTMLPQRMDEVRRELQYVRHLTTLFAGPITVLRYAVYLLDAPPPPPTPVVQEVAPQPDPLDPLEASEMPAGEPSVEGTDDLEGFVPAPEPEPIPEDPTPLQFRALDPNQRALAEQVSQVLANPKLKQRAQVSLFQYDETVRTYHEMAIAAEDIGKCSPEEAWERLGELGIERLKGKAYAICGFYDNFKNDPVINRVFPAPNQPPKQATGPLGNGGGKTAPLVQPVVQPVIQPVIQPVVPPGEPQSGLLGKLKGLFNK